MYVPKGTKMPPIKPPLPGYTFEQWSALTVVQRCNLRSRERRAKWYRDNKERVREYRERTKEQRSVARKAWLKKNADKLKAYEKARYDARDKEKTKEKYRRYHQNHKQESKLAWHRRRLRIAKNGGHFTWKQFQVIKASYNFTCLCCGKREPEIKLTADHVIPLSKYGSNGIDNIQPLCLQCNKSKGAKIMDYRPERNATK